MKKLFLASVILLLSASICFGAPYWLPRQYFNTDQQITTTRTVIYDFTIYFRDVTVGDWLYFRNGLTPYAEAFFTFIAPTTDGTYTPPPFSRPLVVDQGLYLDVGVSGGMMGTSITYQ